MAADTARRASGRLAGVGAAGQAGLALLSGVLVGLGHAPFGLWPATLAGLVLLGVVFARAADWRRAALLVWLAGAASVALSMHWIVEPFLVDVARHGWMAPFGLVFLSGGLALFWGAAGGLARALGGPRVGLPLLAALLPLVEMARGYVLTGFPWNLPGYVWIDTGLAQAAAWIGPYGLSALTLILPLASAWLWHRGRGGARSTLVAVLPVAALAAAALLWPQPDPAMPAADRPVVRLVQPNAPQHLKWDPEHAARFYRRSIDYTAATPRPDLVVWPETAIPSLLRHAGPALENASHAAGGVPTVIGLTRSEGGRYFNSLVVLGAGGEVTDLYDKHHLVPFGEYLPLGAVLGRLGISALADLQGGGYAPGPGPRLVDLGPIGRALPLICYEAIFPEEVGGAPERPELLMQITNDAWFGTFSGPYQHLVQARFRAIEQGLPMLRAANTGVSAMIDPQGQVTARIPLGEAGFLDAALPPPLAPTLYARTGDLPVFAALLLMALAAFVFGGLRRR